MSNKKATKVKTTYFFKKEVEITDRISELRVKLDFNIARATFKISAFVTTDQTDIEDPTKVIPAVNELLEDALQFANRKRLDLLQAMKTGDPAQIELFHGHQASEA